MNLNINDLFQKLSPKTLLIIGAFVVVFVFIVFLSLVLPGGGGDRISNSLTPTPVSKTIPTGIIIPTPVIQVPPSININRLGTVTFGDLNGSFPTSASLYTFTPTQLSQTDVQKIAGIIGITTQGQSIQTEAGPALNYQDGNKNLTIYYALGSIQYFSGVSPTSRNVADQKDVIKIADNFTRSFTPYTDGLAVNESAIQYFIGAGDLKETNAFSSADVYVVPFVQKINDLTVYSQLGNAATASVWVTKSGEIQRLTFMIPSELTATQTRGIISLEEAKTKITNGEGVITSYGPPNSYGTYATPERTNLTSVQLGYLTDMTNGILYPIYVFRGVANNSEQALPIIVYLPATK